VEQLLVKRIDAAKALEISVDTLDWLCQTGKIRKITIGSRVYFSPEELRAFVKEEGKLC
jgi:hypothetical protein